MIQTQKYQPRCPDHCLKLERWQGPPLANKQYETVLFFKVSLFIQS